MRAAHEPTFPKPCTTQVVSEGVRPTLAGPPRGTCRRGRARWPTRARRSPRARSACRSRSRACGRASLPYSSISQAITCALVLTSGAMMSRFGPSTLWILSMKRARDRLQLVRRELVAGAVDAALRAAVRDADDRGLPRHQHRQRAHLVQVDVGVVAQAALVRAAGAVVLHAVPLEDVDLAVVLSAPGSAPTSRGRRCAAPRARRRGRRSGRRRVEVVPDDLDVADRRPATPAAVLRRMPVGAGRNRRLL